MDFLTPDRRQSGLGFEIMAVVPANTSRHIRSCSRRSGRVQAENPPTTAVQISRTSSGRFSSFMSEVGIRTYLLTQKKKSRLSPAPSSSSESQYFLKSEAHLEISLHGVILDPIGNLARPRNTQRYVGSNIHIQTSFEKQAVPGNRRARHSE